MNVIEIRHDGMNVYIFIFDDGILLRVTLDKYWVYNRIKLEYMKFNKANLDYDNEELYEYDLIHKRHISMIKSTDTMMMDRWYYILTNVISFVRYYPSTGEWIDPYKPCYEKHELMDIKHKLHNLRKTSTIKWGHYDIIRNVDQYNDYCKVNKFARESIINFYSRFLKLSILNNNKTLRWILDATESFINYGFVVPNDNLITKCVAPKQKEFGCMFCGGGEKTVDVFSSVAPDEADTFEYRTEIETCPYQMPHPTDDVKWCKYVQFYYPKMKWNKRVGVRQKTTEIIKMQLTNDQFVWTGKCVYSIYNKYINRMVIKSKTITVFNQLIEILFDRHSSLVDEVQHDPSGYILIVPNMNRKLIIEYEISEPNITYLIRFLILNKSYLGTFVSKSKLTLSHIDALLKIPNKHSECTDGTLMRLKGLLLKQKLLCT